MWPNKIAALQLIYLQMEIYVVPIAEHMQRRTLISACVQHMCTVNLNIVMSNY